MGTETALGSQCALHQAASEGPDANLGKEAPLLRLRPRPAATVK